MLESVLDVAIQAGKEILDVYENEFEVDYKGDGSPLTKADQRAHQLIQHELTERYPDIPILSEESSEDVFEMRLQWNRFWLVDPLDGTKEFVKRNGEFTVNIALIENAQPVLGVVHTPVTSISHFAAVGVGAFKQTGCEAGEASRTPISVRAAKKQAVTMVASRSHSGKEVEQFKRNVEQEWGDVEIVSMGSSLKLCLVAEGAADVYPRLGPTSEWDTAAAHAVVEIAGGLVVDLQGQRLQYNKPNILNPWFLVGGLDVDWTKYTENL